MRLTRRQFHRTLAAGAAVAAGVSLSACDRRSSQPKWLLFTKSAGFEHETIKRKGKEASFLAAQLTPIFASRGLTLVESKDGRRFEPGTIDDFAGFVFYTSGDLTAPGTDGTTPMSALGKETLLKSIAAGKPFIGLHCASFTFRREKDQPVDDYTRMLGGAFEADIEPQLATPKLVDPSFPGAGTQADWSFVEEWYALRNLANDLRPIHVLDPSPLKTKYADRAPYPITWTREHGQGRVFYTTMGHREEVIASAAYQRLIGGAIDWTSGGGPTTKPTTATAVA